MLKFFIKKFEVYKIKKLFFQYYSHSWLIKYINNWMYNISNQFYVFKKLTFTDIEMIKQISIASKLG